jgi:hypothetical protein
MKHQISKAIVVLAAAGFVLAMAPAAHATARSCVREAKRDAKDCGATCKETFQTDKDTCLNRDHVCVDACRANRAQCRLDSGFDGLIDDGNDTLEAARASVAPTTRCPETSVTAASISLRSPPSNVATPRASWPSVPEAVSQRLPQLRQGLRATGRASRYADVHP